MAPPIPSPTPQSQAAPAGHWKLAGGRAMTLRPREAGVFRMAQGSVWATFDGPHGGPRNDQGDHFIGAGGRLTLGRGQALVVEARDRDRPVYFSWDPLPRQAMQRARAATLAQAAADLRLAVVLGASAAGRLLAALAGLGAAWLGRDRPALAECAFKAHSRA